MILHYPLEFEVLSEKKRASNKLERIIWPRTKRRAEYFNSLQEKVKRKKNLKKAKAGRKLKVSGLFLSASNVFNVSISEI
jgi:hypothetical protein